jgi:hypothetical protein
MLIFYLETEIKETPELRRSISLGGRHSLRNTLPAITLSLMGPLGAATFAGNS